MIQVKTVKNGPIFSKVKVLGHAMYDDYGHDIVCSAVSSIVITTINGILALDKDSLSYIVSKKGMDITIKSDDKVVQVLIRNMLSLLKELEVNYPNNIQVK